MKQIKFVAALLILSIFGAEGICGPSYDGTESVNECLKKFVGLRDGNRRDGLRKECFNLAIQNYQYSKSYEDLWNLVKTAERMSYLDKRGLKPFYKDFFLKYFPPFNLEGLSHKEIEFLFQSYLKVFFYLQQNNALLERSLKLYEKIKSFREISIEEKENLLKSLIFNHSWDLTEKFQTEFSITGLDPMILRNLKNLELQPNKGGPKFYEIDSSGELSVKNFLPPKEFFVVIVSSPQCGFSVNALKEIEANQNLLNFFKKYGIFITSEWGFLEIGEIKKWNKDHPVIPLKLVYQEKEWPSSIIWSGTPTFVFFRGDKFFKSIDYWDKEEISKTIERLENIR